MATEDKGRTDPAGASSAAPQGTGTPPPQTGADEPHILEEHIVAPPLQIPRPSVSAPQPGALVPTSVVPPVVPQPISVVPPAQPVQPPQPVTPPQTTLQAGVAMAASTMASLLEKIKLPERRGLDAKPAESKKYDTSLAAETKTPEEKEAAHEAAIATARAITEKMPDGASQNDVRALHTLKDDLQNVVRDKKISLVRAVALEEEKRHHGTATEEHLEVQVRKESRTRFALFLAGLLFVVGLIAIGAVLFIMSERTQKMAAPITASVLFSEQSVPLSVDALAPADLRREIGNARNSASLTLGAILQIVPVMQKDVAGQPATVPITFGEFLEKIGSHAPPELARSLSNDFFLGLHTVDENAPLIVIPVTSYEMAFAAMLAWEPAMNADLAPIFTQVSMQALGPNGLPVERRFEDTVMRNYDVRALKDDSGTIQLYYSFPTRNVLIIAESPYSFSEILSRLRADRKL